MKAFRYPDILIVFSAAFAANIIFLSENSSPKNPETGSVSEAEFFGDFRFRIGDIAGIGSFKTYDPKHLACDDRFLDSFSEEVAGAAIENDTGIYSDAETSETDLPIKQGSPKTFPIEPKRPVVPPKKPTAPMPYIYKKTADGKRVCGTKNDDPHKSKKHKKKHMDMECCLDPDEYPNPHCYYPESKYGKYLK